MKIITNNTSYILQYILVLTDLYSYIVNQHQDVPLFHYLITLRITSSLFRPNVTVAYNRFLLICLYIYMYYRLTLYANFASPYRTRVLQTIWMVSLFQTLFDFKDLPICPLFVRDNFFGKRERGRNNKSVCNRQMAESKSEL